MAEFKKDDLYDWRIAKNLTQEQAASTLLVSTSAYRKWEQGERAIPPMVGLLINRLRPSDYPRERGSVGKRPIGVRDRADKA